MKNYYQANRERFLSELFELLRIPSISSDPAHKDDMYACARKLTSLLKEAGAHLPAEGGRSGQGRGI